MRVENFLNGVWLRGGGENDGGLEVFSLNPLKSFIFKMKRKLSRENLMAK